jgi:hypothetical protein
MAYTPPANILDRVREVTLFVSVTFWVFPVEKSIVKEALKVVSYAPKVHFSKFPLDGVPSAPPFITGEPAVLIFIPNAVPTPVPTVGMLAGFCTTRDEPLRVATPEAEPGVTPFTFATVGFG